MDFFMAWSPSVLVMLIGAVVPFWKILPRAGIPAPWSLTVLFVPMLIVWLLVLALKKWPYDNVAGVFE